MNVHEGRVAVVTGSARSMGQQIAKCFAERGAKVVGIDILDLSETGALVRNAGAEWLGLKGDLTSEGFVNDARAKVEAQFGGADILVNVAGILTTLDWDETDYETWKRVMTVNVDSQFLTCKAFIPYMRQQRWGRIINFSSGITRSTMPKVIAYRASKSAIIGFTRGLAGELGQDNITANSVSPSFVLTEGNIEEGNEALQPFITEAQAIKRPSTSNDIVGLVSFLASDDAAFVTAQMMQADGGLVPR